MKTIDIIKYNFGFNTKEAKEYMKTIDIKTIEALKQGFENNAKTSFYND